MSLSLVRKRLALGSAPQLLAVLGLFEHVTGLVPGVVHAFFGTILTLVLQSFSGLSLIPGFIRRVLGLVLTLVRCVAGLFLELIHERWSFRVVCLGSIYIVSGYRQALKTSVIKA